MPSPGHGDSASAVLKGIQQASGGVKFGANVQLNAEAVAKDAQDAGALSDVIKLVAQMVQMHSQNGNAPAEFTNLLKSLVVTTDGNTVKVSLSLPESEIEALFKMAQSHHNEVQRI